MISRPHKGRPTLHFSHTYQAPSLSVWPICQAPTLGWPWTTAFADSFGKILLDLQEWASSLGVLPPSPRCNFPCTWLMFLKYIFWLRFWLIVFSWKVVFPLVFPNILVFDLYKEKERGSIICTVSSYNYLPTTDRFF